MHEMSLAEGVIQILEQSAQEQGYSEVKTIWLEIGELSNVEVESLTFCMEAVCKGTVADQARVEIIHAPGEAWCMECRQTVAVHALYDPCPQCGGFQVQVTGGNEMRVKELEVA